MAKKRKTKSQKLAADFRHQNLPPSLSSTIIPTQEISLADIGIKPKKISTFSPVRPSDHSIEKEYSYVRHDLKKTSLITSAIILVELVLFFVVKL
jgi:hypothetical protein